MPASSSLKFEEALKTLFEMLEFIEDDDEMDADVEEARATLEDRVKSVRTYEEVGLLTRDNGIVVRMKNGAEFQITIKQAGGPYDDEEDDEPEFEECGTCGKPQPDCTCV